MKPILDAAATDPKANRTMEGFPAPPERQIKLHDGTSWRFPAIRWAFSHQRELTPTAGVRRGAMPPRELMYGLRQDIDAVAFTTQDGRPMTWGESLAANYTDGILVLHKGRIVFERYFGASGPHIPHLAMSVTKSFVGLFAAMQAHAGELDPEKLAPYYVPELKDTAYGDATVRQIMDMTIGVQYSENYTDPAAEIFAYTAASGIAPRRPDYKGPESIFEFLQGLKKQGRHGEAFAYKTCNTEALGWIVQRVSGIPFAQMLSEHLWQKLGMEEDAYVLVDRTGAAMCGGGLNMTLRDMARFGQMMLMRGASDGRQIVPEAVVSDIAGGADRDCFAKAGYTTLPGWSYRNQWWNAHGKFGEYTARGIHGQVIWIAPAAELVIARFASHPTAANGNGPLDHVSLPAYAAVARHLMRS